MEIKRSPKLLVKNKTAVLLIDVQERIIKAMHENERVVENCQKLIKGSIELNIPVYVTEQYPKGLGSTIPEVKGLIPAFKPIEKLSFSCMGAGDLFKNLKLANIQQVVVCGIEAHVCVQQTVFDLLANEFQVYLAADACSSRREFDFKIALDRMTANGIEVTTTESILFELLDVCGTPEFKAISKIVK